MGKTSPGKTVIRNATIISMDIAVGDLACGDILVDGDVIAEIAPSIGAVEGAEEIDGTGTIAIPGLVNAHMHTWQTGLKGAGSDWTMGQYIRAMHAGLATHFRPDDIRIGTLAGALNQIAGGVTTLADWCHNNPTPDHTEAGLDGLEASGIRAVFLHGSPKPDPKPGQKHFSEVPMPRSEVERLRKGRLASDDALVTLGLAILGPYYSTYEVSVTDLKLGRELDLVTSCHASGKAMNADGFERLVAAGLVDGRLNIVHANDFPDDRIKCLVDAGANFTVTAEVELQMGFGDAITGRLTALGAPCSIGVDVESAVTGSMFAHTRFTLQAQRNADTLTTQRTGTAPGPFLTTRDALRWATMDGARMLRLDHRIGSLTPGKQADIVLVRRDALNTASVIDPVSIVVNYAEPANVDTVLIAGEVKKRAGRLVAGGIEAIVADLRSSGRRILTDAGLLQ